jgi:hypothetical protein
MKTAISALAAVLLTACSTTTDYAPRVQVWAARDFSKQSQGPNPVGTALISQPLPFYGSLYFEHKSSMATKHDKGELNSAGIGFCVKIPAKRCD